jgi:shikimate kinase
MIPQGGVNKGQGGGVELINGAMIDYYVPQAGAFVIYLKVFPAVAANRSSGDGTRPLLVGDDPLARMKKLLDEREPFYKKADIEVFNDSPRTAEQAADEVLQIAREKAGWP